jgi:hypothetical protein
LLPSNARQVQFKLRESPSSASMVIVEVAFAVNIERDVELLKLCGSIATYATNAATPTIASKDPVHVSLDLVLIRV